MKSIYDLKLHESTYAVDGIHASLCVLVTRVAGGWVYNSFDTSNNIGSSVFVPYNNEFIDERS